MRSGISKVLQLVENPQTIAGLVPDSPGGVPHDELNGCVSFCDAGCHGGTIVGMF
jgi:hypothetical protein